MINSTSNEIIQEYHSFLRHSAFPCIGAKAALARQNILCMVATHIACPGDDSAILEFLYDFIDHFRHSEELYHSATVIFRQPVHLTEELFEKFFWSRLQALADVDRIKYPYDERVSHDPSAANFSFSLKSEALFIVGLHPASARMARRFSYPALAFNPHIQFEHLRETKKYERIKQAVRKRDIVYSGSINPMLQDFGSVSEAHQYSGRQHDEQWECPLITQYEKSKGNSTP